MSPITKQTQVECGVGICPTYICRFFVSEKMENTQITWCLKYLMFPNDLMAMNNNPLASTRNLQEMSEMRLTSSGHLI